MTALAAKTLELARGAKGVTEHPAGSNDGVEIREYLADVAVYVPAKWCAAFVSSKVKRAGIALATPVRFRGSASVRELLALNAALEIAVPEPGCVFIHIGPKGNHCGLVESMTAGGALETIEGNSDAHGSRTGGSVVAGFRRAGYATHYLLIT